MSDSGRETEVQQLCGDWTALVNSLNDHVVAELMNMGIGQYLDNHPFLTLVVLVFGTIATVPIGLFLVFTLITIIFTAVCFAVLEGVLLLVGLAILLCVLSGLALLSILISSIVSAFYVTTYYTIGFYS